jgi:hypothetical protein
MKGTRLNIHAYQSDWSDEDEETYEEEFDAEEIIGVPQEDRDLFNTFANPGQRRNLADLITAKLEAHENREKVIEQSEPRAPSLPPKVIEVFKKYFHFKSG